MAVVLAEDNEEHPIPPELRPIFKSITDAFSTGDFRLEGAQVQSVVPIDFGTAAYMAANVEDYGEQLVPLHPDVWDRACYSFQGTYWDAIVDLSTGTEKVSDLAMHARIRTRPNLQVEIWSIHVP